MIDRLLRVFYLPVISLADIAVICIIIPFLIEAYSHWAYVLLIPWFLFSVHMSKKYKE